MPIWQRSLRRSRRKIIGYKINGLVYLPADVIVMYSEKPHRIRKTVKFMRLWYRVHWRPVIWFLIVILAILITAYVTSKHPT